MDVFFLKEYAGAKFRSIAPNEYSQLYVVSSLGGYNYESYLYPPQKTVTATGMAYYLNENVVFLQISENPLLAIRLEKGNLKWQGISQSSKTYTQAQAQDLVNGIIRNNQYIFNNNLLCARFANKLSVEQRKMLYNLQDRLEKRDAALREGEVFSSMGKEQPEGYSEFSSYLEAFMKNPGIGVITLSTTGIIIISAIVIGSLSTAAYYAYQAYYKESEQDVKYSRELTQTLQQKLTEEEYQQLLNETAGLLTKQRIMQQIGSIGSSAKNLLLLGLGLIIALRVPKWIKAVQDKPVDQKLLK